MIGSMPIPSWTAIPMARRAARRRRRSARRRPGPSRRGSGTAARPDGRRRPRPIVRNPTQDLGDRSACQPERRGEEKRERQHDGDLGGIRHEHEVESTGTAKRPEPAGRPDDDGEIHGQDDRHDGRLAGRGPAQVQHAGNDRRQDHAEHEDEDRETRVGDVGGADQGRRPDITRDRASGIPGRGRSQARLQDRQQAEKRQRRRPWSEPGWTEGAEQERQDDDAGDAGQRDGGGVPDPVPDGPSDDIRRSARVE